MAAQNFLDLPYFTLLGFFNVWTLPTQLRRDHIVHKQMFKSEEVGLKLFQSVTFEWTNITNQRINFENQAFSIRAREKERD